MDNKNFSNGCCYSEESQPNQPISIITPKLTHKIVILGDSGCGKTSLLHRIIKGEFKENIPTIGAAFDEYIIGKDSNNPLKCQIWDTAGQERFNCVTPLYLRDADVVMIAFSVNNHRSFINIAKWRSMAINISPECIFVLVSTKADLAKGESLINLSIASHKLSLFKDYITTSAKSGYGIDDVFISIHKLLTNSQSG